MAMSTAWWEELGDVLLHVLFQIEIGREKAEFTPEDVFGGVIDKLRRRHPHVFGDADAGDADEVMANWQAIKRRERREAGESILDGVPKSMPALAQAQAVQQRAAHAGFDWDDVSDVLDKLAEEVGELAESESAAEREAEFGDLLFAAVNAARWMDLDAEEALRKANARFYRRFALMEADVPRAGRVVRGVAARTTRSGCGRRRSGGWRPGDRPAFLWLNG